MTAKSRVKVRRAARLGSLAGAGLGAAKSAVGTPIGMEIGPCAPPLPSAAGRPRWPSRLKTLRYTPGDNQIWGFNVLRNIRRKNEQVFLAPIPRGYDIYRVSLAAKLEGLQLPGRRDVKVTPFALGSTREDNLATSNQRQSDFEIGIDAEVGRDAQPHGGLHRQHRLRSSRNGRAADQPDPLSAVFSGKAPRSFSRTPRPFRSELPKKSIFSSRGASVSKAGSRSRFSAAPA